MGPKRKLESDAEHAEVQKTKKQLKRRAESIRANVPRVARTVYQSYDEAESEDEKIPQSPTSTMKATAPRPSKSSDTYSDSFDEAPATKKAAAQTDQKKKLRAATERARVAERQVKELTADKRRIEKEVQTLQTKVLAHSSQGHAFQMDNNTIMTSFRNLVKKTHDWSGNNARTASLLDELNERNTACVLHSMHGLNVKLPHEMLQPSKAHMFPSEKGGCRGAAQALIEHTVAYQILARPLHFVPAPAGWEFSAGEDVLTTLHARMKDDQNDRRLPGALTRLLYKSEQLEGTPATPITDDHFEGTRAAYYDNLVQMLLEDLEAPLRPLLKANDDVSFKKSCASLRNIFNSAGKLALQLCASDVVVMVHGWDKAGDDSFFQTGSANLEWHTIVNWWAKDTKLHRNNIGLVVRPQITHARLDFRGRTQSPTTACKGVVTAFMEKKFAGTIVEAKAAKEKGGLVTSRKPKVPEHIPAELPEEDTIITGKEPSVSSEHDHKIQEPTIEPMQWEHDSSTVADHPMQAYNDGGKDADVDDHVAGHTSIENRFRKAFSATSGTTKNFVDLTRDDDGAESGIVDADTATLTQALQQWQQDAWAATCGGSAIALPNAEFFDASGPFSGTEEHTDENGTSLNPDLTQSTVCTRSAVGARNNTAREPLFNHKHDPSHSETEKEESGEEEEEAAGEEGEGGDAEIDRDAAEVRAEDFMRAVRAATAPRGTARVHQSSSTTAAVDGAAHAQQENLLPPTKDEKEPERDLIEMQYDNAGDADEDRISAMNPQEAVDQPWPDGITDPMEIDAKEDRDPAAALQVFHASLEQSHGMTSTMQSTALDYNSSPAKTSTFTEHPSLEDLWTCERGITRVKDQMRRHGSFIGPG